MTVLIKRYPEKGEFPIKEGLYHTNIGRVSFSNTFDWFNHHNYTCPRPSYWLEEIELPSEKDIIIEADKIDNWKESYEFERGANFILNKLKGETK